MLPYKQSSLRNRLRQSAELYTFVGHKQSIASQLAPDAKTANGSRKRCLWSTTNCEPCSMAFLGMVGRISQADFFLSFGLDSDVVFFSAFVSLLSLLPSFLLSVVLDVPLSLSAAFL